MLSNTLSGGINSHQCHVTSKCDYLTMLVFIYFQEFQACICVRDYSCFIVINSLLKVKMTSRANCCVPGCNSVYKKNPDLTFHHFPNEGQRVENIGESGMVTTVDRKKLWEIKLKIGKRVTKNMRVCSKHFVEDDFITPSDWGYQKRYLKKTAVPSKNLPVSSVTTKSKSLKIEEKKRRYEKLMEKRQVNQLPSTSKDDMISSSFSDFDGAKALLELQQQELPFVEDTTKETLHTMKIFVDVATQTDNKEVCDEEIQVNTNWSSISDFIQTEKALNILTGIPSFSLLILLVNLFTSFKKDSRCQRLSVKERVILVFLKFKLDLTYSALGVLFGGLSVPTCRRIFQDTIEVLSGILANFVYLPSKEEVLKNMPICFSKFQNVRIVLDCTEMKVQVPKKLCCRIKLYSHYKKNHTLKFMTAVTPAGFIAYASPSYGGRASDKSIFEQSQIVEQLIPYVDEVMVDKGFLIESSCEEFGIKIIRPPFLRKKKQFDRGEASMNRSIASARVHIERVNASIKVFRIFRNTFPLHLVPIVHNIFKIICGIVNLGSPILRDDLFLH